jgi:inner membrane protein
VDNVTHTLIGVLAGEAVHRFLPPSAVLSDRARRTVAIGVLAVGSNLPDADVLYTTVAGTTGDYLLHHRGYTHTFLAALGASVLLYLAVRLWWRFRGIKPRPADTWLLVGLSLAGPLLHIALDFTNNYGVHPFWPVDNHWYYGDAVFIVEPLLWACTAVLLFVLPSRVLRVLIALVIVAGLGLSWFSGFVPALFAALLTVFVLGLAAVGRFASARVAVASGLAAWLAVTAGFVAASHAAGARVQAILADAFPTARTLDVALTPLPANPVCHEVLAVQTTTDAYVVRRGFHSLAPDWIPANACARFYPLRGDRTAPLDPVAQPTTDEIAWSGELTMPVDRLAGLATEYCAVAALLQFARAPWATPADDGWIVGDLRYDTEPGRGFAETYVGPDHDECPRLLAPWLPPRADLLNRR